MDSLWNIRINLEGLVLLGGTSSKNSLLKFAVLPFKIIYLFYIDSNLLDFKDLMRPLKDIKRFWNLNKDYSVTCFYNGYEISIPL